MFVLQDKVIQTKCVHNNASYNYRAIENNHKVVVAEVTSVNLPDTVALHTHPSRAFLGTCANTPEEILGVMEKVLSGLYNAVEERERWLAGYERDLEFDLSDDTRRHVMNMQSTVQENMGTLLEAIRSLTTKGEED